MAQHRSGRLSTQAGPRRDGAGYDEEQVAAIRRWPIDATEKGFGGPAHQSPVTAGELAGERLSAGFLSTPRVLLREQALRHNIAAMAAYCAANAVSLFPHGKTTMAPQILAAQLDAGAAGVTAASISQVRVFRRFGVRSVLLANEVVDDASISWLATELTEDEQFSFLCYVDSVTGAGRLDEMLAARGFTAGCACSSNSGTTTAAPAAVRSRRRSTWRPPSGARRDSSSRVWLATRAPCWPPRPPRPPRRPGRTARKSGSWPSPSPLRDSSRGPPW